MLVVADGNSQSTKGFEPRDGEFYGHDTLVVLSKGPKISEIGSNTSFIVASVTCLGSGGVESNGGQPVTRLGCSGCGTGKRPARKTLGAWSTWKWKARLWW
jgi:hypothetical protein